MPPTNTIPTSQQMYEKLYQLSQNIPPVQKLPQIKSEDTIYQDLLGRVQQFRPQYEQLAKLEAQAYETPATYYKDLTSRYGEGVGKGLSAQGEIASMASNVGRQLATTDTARRILETQRGTLADLAKTLYATRLQDQETMLRNMELERQKRQDEISMLGDLYNIQLAREEAARVARGGGGGGGGGLGDIQIQTSQAKQDTSDGMHYNEQTGKFEYWDKGKRIQTFKTEEDANRFIYEFGKKAEQKPDGRTPEEIRLSQLTPEQLQQERLAKYQQMREYIGRAGLSPLTPEQLQQERLAKYQQMQKYIRRTGLSPV